jgi:pre-mRNA-processing factor 17
MSLQPGYSSDEEESRTQVKNDLFGLANIPVTKKIRVEGDPASIVPQAAPDVLTEVTCVVFLSAGK